MWLCERLSEMHDLAAFDCDNEKLNDWLRRHARNNEGRASRTFVVPVRDEVIGYYSLAAGSVMRGELPRKLRHGTPEPVPIIVLGRLAVDNRHKKRGLGAALLKDAILRSLGAGESVGVLAIMVHAIDDQAGAFYRKYGFVSSPTNELTFVLPMETAKAVLR
jgi:GNAT superfamily N-acetyltransferase